MTKKSTIRAIVVQSWSVDSRFGVAYFFRLRPVNSIEGDEFTSTIPANILAAAPCGEHGRIHSLIGAEVEVSGRMTIDYSKGRVTFSRPRGRVVKLTPAMASLLAEEQEREAYIKKAWATDEPELEVSAGSPSRFAGCPLDEEA